MSRKNRKPVRGWEAAIPPSYTPERAGATGDAPVIDEEVRRVGEALCYNTLCGQLGIDPLDPQVQAIFDQWRRIYPYLPISDLTEEPQG